MRRTAVLAAFALLVAAPAAQAIPHLPPDPAPVAGNPADRMLDVPIEDSVYDPATHCNRHGRPRKHVNVTLAHRDHIHFGLSKAGAMALTSFCHR